jgi:hypothetical protein
VASYIVKNKPRGGILIFLTGVQEIRQCINALGTVLGKQAEILPLHANLTSDEQRQVFRPTQKWKIVVSTNVAEVSQNHLKLSVELTWSYPDIHYHRRHHLCPRFGQGERDAVRS